MRLKIVADLDAQDRVARLDAAALVTTTRNGDADMVWRVWGAGPPVVLLHGGIGSWRHWARNIDVLAGTHRVLAPDTPGLGQSVLPPEPQSPQSIAAIIADGLGSLLGPGERCDLVGFSFGAMLAGVVCARRPDLVASLTLVGAGGLGIARGETPVMRVLDKAGPERREAHRHNLAVQMIADPALIDDEALAIQDTNASLARIRSVRFSTSTALLDVLPGIRAPLTAIWGAEDAVAKASLPARIAAMRGAQPGLAAEIVPNAGHWVAFEAADAFNAILAGVLRRSPNAAHT